MRYRLMREHAVVKPTRQIVPENGMRQRVIMIMSLLSLIWVSSIVAFFIPNMPIGFALIPRDYTQWWGVVSWLFVHRDFSHLLANTVPLGLFLMLAQLKGSRFFYSSLTIAILLSGVLLWLFGRNGAHIGASGLVFALFGLLLANAVFARRLADVLVALVIIAGYWGLIAQVLPADPGISWDGHLCGLIAGVTSSWVVTKLAG